MRLTENTAVLLVITAMFALGLIDEGWTRQQFRHLDRRMTETVSPFGDEKYFCLDEKTCGILGIRGEH